VINIGYNPPGSNDSISFAHYYSFDHYRPLVEEGAVQVANSEEDLVRLMKAALLKPGQYSENRKTLLSNFFGNTLDGNSSLRVSRALQSIIPKTTQSLL
jgi:hypothetical protein